MNTSAVRLPFLPQLDSFRFFAVLLVIIAHWLPFTKLNIVPNGCIGVTFFFVLSGFLITSNLLITKKQIEEQRKTIGKAILTFYVRRSIRIFPLYFLVILLVYAAVPKVFNGQLVWYLTYAPNFLIYFTRVWPGMLSHFWSLGVEEQFYFIWPFLIYLTPWKLLKYLFPSVIVLSIVFKIMFFRTDGAFFNFYDVLPLSCFDSFAVGALLALWNIEQKDTKPFLLRIPIWMGISVFFVLSLIVFFLKIPFLFGLTVSGVCFYLVSGAIPRFKGLPGAILDNKILQYLGKISYGLYIYHNFIPWMLRCIRGTEETFPFSIRISSLSWLQGGGPTFIAHFILLVFIASLSWFLIERPINNLKKYFI